MNKSAASHKLNCTKRHLASIIRTSRTREAHNDRMSIDSSSRDTQKYQRKQTNIRRTHIKKHSKSIKSTSRTQKGQTTHSEPWDWPKRQWKIPRRLELLWSPFKIACDRLYAHTEFQFYDYESNERNSIPPRTSEAAEVPESEKKPSLYFINQKEELSRFFFANFFLFTFCFQRHGPMNDCG